MTSKTPEPVISVSAVCFSVYLNLWSPCRFKTDTSDFPACSEGCESGNNMILTNSAWWVSFWLFARCYHSDQITAKVEGMCSPHVEGNRRMMGTWRENTCRNPVDWWKKSTSICLNTVRTGDADLRFYVTTVQEGWPKSAFLTRACFPCTVRLIMQYIEPVCEWSCWWMFIETWPHSELTIRHRASSI